MPDELLPLLLLLLLLLPLLLPPPESFDFKDDVDDLVPPPPESVDELPFLSFVFVPADLEPAPSFEDLPFESLG